MDDFAYSRDPKKSELQPEERDLGGLFKGSPGDHAGEIKGSPETPARTGNTAMEKSVKVDFLD